MQQIFTKEFIFERIKDSNAPLWSLGLVNGFKNVANVMQYNGIDFDEEDAEETKIDKSIRQLSNTISTFPDDSEFVIEMKSSITASRNGVFGPYHFSKTERKPEASTMQPQLGVVPQGYIPESALKGIEESLKKDFDNRLESFKIETERRRREEEFERRCQQLDEREKEIKEMQKEYNSSVAKAADVLIEIGKRIGASFLMPASDAAAQMPQQQLGDAPQTPSQPDPKADAVEALADYLYANFSAEDINKLKQNIIKFQHEQQSQMGESEFATSTASA